MEGHSAAGKPQPGTGKLPWRWLLLIVAGSLAVQLLASANVKLLPDYDEAIYWDVSHNCHERGLFVRSQNQGHLFFDHPPLFLYLASPSFFFTDDIAGFRFVVSLMSLALLVATALLASQHLGADAAVPAAALLGFNPMFVFYANSGYQDVPFMLPTMLAFLAAFEGRAIACGLLTGAAFLVKYFAAGFAGALALYQAAAPERGPRQAARHLAVFASLALLWPVTGLWLDSAGFLGKMGYWKTFLTMESTTAIKHHPVAELGPYVKSIVDRLTLPHTLLLVLAIAWALTNLRKFDWPMRTVTLTAVAYIATLLGPFALRSERYMVEALPLLAILGAGLLQGLTRQARAAALALVSVAGLFIPMPGASRLPPLVRPQYTATVLKYAEDVRLAAQEVARALPPGERVLVNWNGPRIGYLARRPYSVLFTREDFESAAKLVDDARILVRDHESGRWFLPELAPDQIERLERKLAAEFTFADFGKVRVYTRRQAPGVGRS